MAVFKCEMCGATLEIDDNKKVVVCEYCGTQQTIPNLDNKMNAFETDTSSQVEKLFERVFLFLENGEWENADTYCEKILDIEPKCAKAYVGKLMAELRVNKQEYLAFCEKPFDNRINYKNAVYYGDEVLVTELKGYLSHIKERNKKIERDNAYNEQNKKAESNSTDNNPKPKIENITCNDSKQLYKEKNTTKENNQGIYILLVIILIIIFLFIMYNQLKI